MKEGDLGTIYHDDQEYQAKVTMVKCGHHIELYNVDLGWYATFHKAPDQVSGPGGKMVSNKLAGMWVRYPPPNSGDITRIFIPDRGQSKSIDALKVAKLMGKR